jgi:prepilin-type N-terminal cleavage/methylation domain-containing protein
MSKPANKNSRGFTILELVIAMALFLVLSGSVLGGMARLQASYRTAEIRTTMQQRLRATMELLSQEVGQAGLQASTIDNNNTDTSTTAPYTITPAIAANTSPQWVTVNNVGGIYIGQWLQLPGASQPDAIQVQNVTASTANPLQIYAVFAIAHTATSTPAYPMGIFPHGILSDQSTTGTGSKLALFGEFNGPGNGLYAVEYACPATYPGSLVRKELVLPGTTWTTSSLIDNVTFCNFTWTTADTVSLPVPSTYSSAACPTGSPAGYCNYTIVTQVGFTITASESPTISGSTQTVSVTKSYSNIQPRNLIAADNIYNLACSSAGGPGTCTPLTYAQYLVGELQPDPPSLASVPW